MRTAILFVGLAAWTSIATAQAPGTYAVKLLTPETALTAAQAALAHCRKAGHQVAVAVVDRAGVTQVLGTTTTGFGDGIDAGVGFDAITVALLGRSTPLGVLGAAILFGAFRSGGATMQAAVGVPIEIVEVVQALIVLFIAAPPLVRAVFRLPQPGSRPRRTASTAAEVAA